MSGGPDRTTVDLRVLLVTSWDTPCGIAAHSAMLQEAVHRADPGIAVFPDADALDPEDFSVKAAMYDGEFSLIHLNHHDALHSRWTPDHVRKAREAGIPVLVTYHDTTADPSPSSKLAQLARVASSVVVHEPLDPRNAIKAIYWRQPVPAPARAPVDYAHDHHGWYASYRQEIHNGDMENWGKGIYTEAAQPLWKAYPQQPVLGTVGFDFPWKNFDRLARLTADLGWAYVCLSNNMTPERVAQIKTVNPHSLVIPEYLPTPVIVNYLAGCDATAFPYECANTGTSGAIRLGIAALRPVFAFPSCRQFRDLYEDEERRSLIHWVEDWLHFEVQLLTFSTAAGATSDWRSRRLAHQDAWEQAGKNYAQLYRMLVGAGGRAL